jgi:hypothetical protein
MAKRKVQAVKFDAVDKAQIKGKVGHTRTGACTAKGRCYHGRKRTGR